MTELEKLQAELAAATTDSDKAKIAAKIAKLEASMKPKLKLPKVKSLVGILTDVQVLDDNNVVLITVQDSEDGLHTIASGINYWHKVGKGFTEDSCVKIQFEERKAGETGYKEDGSEEFVAHTKDGNNMTGIYKYSAMAFQRQLDNNDLDVKIEKGMTRIEGVEADKATAVATFLSGMLQKR